MRPTCFDRQPAAEGSWMRTGRMTLRLTTPGVQSGPKEHIRWVPRFFEDRCATHDGKGIGPKGENYPDAHGWDCAGCRWEPAQLRQKREFDERMTTVTKSHLLDLWMRERISNDLCATLGITAPLSTSERVTLVFNLPGPDEE